MKRAVALAAVAVALLAPACAGTQRPEGLVERWLTSLNQGAAGRPARYAANALSDQVLPGWAGLDPGQLDVIEVGKARVFANMRFPEGAALVPFRVVDLDGNERTGVALIQRGPDGRTWERVLRLAPPSEDLALPSQGGPPIETATPPMWLAALAAAAVFVALSAGLMALVRRRAVPA